MKVAYHGHEVMTYVNYVDAETGKTLVCEPGGIYDILPDVMPTDGRFTVVIPKENSKAIPDFPEDETESGVTQPVTSTGEVKE
jgi:hypothetical protein